MKPTIQVTKAGFFSRRRQYKLSLLLTGKEAAIEAGESMINELLALLPQCNSIDGIEVEFLGPSDLLKHACQIFLAGLDRKPSLKRWLLEEVPHYSLAFEDPETAWLRALDYCTKDGKRMQIHTEPASDSEFPQEATTLDSTGYPVPMAVWNDDPEFMAATQEAKRRMSEFLDLLKAPQAGVTVGVPHTQNGVREIHHATLVAKNGDQLQVEFLLHDHTEPIRVTYALDQIEDWTVLHANGQRTGGFTTRVMLRRARQQYQNLPPNLKALEQSFSEMMDAERYGPK